MNVGELKKLKVSDEEIVSLAKKESGLKDISKEQAICMQVGYLIALNQIHDAMAAEDEEIGAAMAPKGED